MTPEENVAYNAEWMYNHVVKQIREFEATLDDESEVAVRLASFGSSITMKVSKIGFENPYILYFCGSVDDDDAELIQHMQQLNFLLVAEKRGDPEMPARRLGFNCELTKDC